MCDPFTGVERGESTNAQSLVFFGSEQEGCSVNILGCYIGKHEPCVWSKDVQGSRAGWCGDSAWRGSATTSSRVEGEEENIWKELTRTENGVEGEQQLVHGHAQLIYQEEDWDATRETSSVLHFVPKASGTERSPEDALRSLVDLPGASRPKTGVEKWRAVCQKSREVLFHETGSAFLGK